MKTHTIEHISRTKEDIGWMKRSVEEAVALVRQKLNIQSIKPLRVTYADSDGLDAMWRESKQLRKRFATPLSLFVYGTTVLVEEGLVVICTDGANEMDNARALTRLMAGVLFRHLLRTHFSCRQVESMVRLSVGDAASVPPDVEIALRELFASWVVPMSEEELPTYLSCEGRQQILQLAKTRDLGPLLDEMPPAYADVLAMADIIFGVLVGDQENAGAVA